jgi:hypothetical protein
MKRTLVLTALLAGLTFSLSAAAAPSSATLTIRHQLQGCHAWALNGGPYGVVQHIKIAKGGSLVVVNNDIMPHQLVKTFGPAISIKLIKAGGHMGMPMHGVGMMSHMGATTKVTFSHAGIYKLTTKAGEDYMEMGPTKGEDNVLRAIVHVS